MAPFSIFSNYRDRVYEQKVDKWALSRMAQDKFFIIATKIKTLKKTPQGYNCREFSKFIGDFLFTSTIMGLNWDLALLASDIEKMHAIGDAPRNITNILDAAKDMIKAMNGSARDEFVQEMIQVKSMNMAGLPQNETPAELLKIKIHDQNITRFISEFQIKTLYNPLMSPVVKSVFSEYNFEPSNVTNEILKIADIPMPQSNETRQSNIVYNFMDLSSKIFKNDYKKGCKIYDILLESFDCVMPAGDITSYPENSLCAPLHNCLE